LSRPAALPSDCACPEPALSVVLVASDSAAAVLRALAALEPQRGAGRVEVIVAAARDRLAAPPAGGAAPVRWVIAAPGTSVPRLRRLGLDRAAAPLVAFTEDSCVFAPGWAEAWIAAFDDPSVTAATGPVEAAMGERATDWAVFLCEYAPFLARAGDRQGAGSPWRLAGNNFAVRRCAGDALAPHEIHETEVAAALAGRAGALVAAAGARVGHVRRFALRQAIGDRLRFGRDYGRLRAGRWPQAARLMSLCAGPLVLGVQAARLTATLIARRRHLGRLLEVLPVTLGLLSAWSVGEWLGWMETLVRPPAARRRRAGAGRPGAGGPARARWRPGHCTAGPPAA
jgi:hypothetical protein